MTVYVVHYTDNRGGDPQERQISEIFNSVALVDLINDGRTYTISVEAQSFHLSGESASVDVVCKFTTVFLLNHYTCVYYICMHVQRVVTPVVLVELDSACASLRESL